VEVVVNNRSVVLLLVAIVIVFTVAIPAINSHLSDSAFSHLVSLGYKDVVVGAPNYFLVGIYCPSYDDRSYLAVVRMVSGREANREPVKENIVVCVGMLMEPYVSSGIFMWMP
jgi:hypothetical protein